MTYEEMIRMDGDRHAQTILELRENAERIFAAAKHRDRRERIATAALQGMIADSSRRVNPNDYAKVAVERADALIAELDKKVKP